jgi:hypothetical protein
MAFLDQEFNADDFVTTNNFDPLPEGWYNVAIAGAEVKNTKAGNGQYIAIKYTVTGPTHQGRVVFGNLNIKNPNPRAEEIGRQQLGDLMRAVGLAKIKDTDQLIGGNLAIKLTVKPADGQYDASNDIKGFKAIVGASLPQPAGMPQSAPAAPAAPSAAPPWARK